jgi:hypothetical protein
LIARRRRRVASRDSPAIEPRLGWVHRPGRLVAGLWQRFLALARPELVEDALGGHTRTTDGHEVITEVRSKLNALTSADHPNPPA